MTHYGYSVACQSIALYGVNSLGGVRCKLWITLDDDRVSRCLEVVKRHSDGLATEAELSAAKKAAAKAAEDAASVVERSRRGRKSSQHRRQQRPQQRGRQPLLRGQTQRTAAEAAAGAADAASAASVVWAEQKIKLREILDSGTWRD